MTDVARSARPVTPATSPAKPVSSETAAPVVRAEVESAAPQDALVSARKPSVADAGRSAAETHVAASLDFAASAPQQAKVPANVQAVADRFKMGEVLFSDEYAMDPTTHYTSTYFKGGSVHTENGKITAANVNTVYTVKAGDTLTAIAKKHDTTVDVLAEINGLTNPDKIQVGQQLYTGEHGRVVLPGDTLSKIAREYGMDVKDLAEMNDIKNPNLIQAWSVLKVPQFGC